MSVLLKVTFFTIPSKKTGNENVKPKASYKSTKSKTISNQDDSPLFIQLQKLKSRKLEKTCKGDFISVGCLYETQLTESNYI